MASDILRGRDCIVFVKGDTFPIVVDQTMVEGGWPGGQGVQWAPQSTDELVVTYSNGLFGGVLLWGSDESADQYTAMTGQFAKYRFATFMAGKSILSTSTYERYTYASRQAGGPFVPLSYASNEPLFFSRRGYWTNEDEMDLSGDPMAPALPTGFVAQIPKTLNNHFLGIQVL